MYLKIGVSNYNVAANGMDKKALQIKLLKGKGLEWSPLNHYHETSLGIKKNKEVMRK